MFTIKGCGMDYEIRAIDNGIFRFRMAANGEYTESLLSRYNILKENGEIDAEWAENDETYTVIAGGIILNLFS